MNWIQVIECLFNIPVECAYLFKFLELVVFSPGGVSIEEASVEDSLSTRRGSSGKYYYDVIALLTDYAGSFQDSSTGKRWCVVNIAVDYTTSCQKLH